MNKVERYRQELRSLASWDDFLLCESRLPGPRANLELAFAVALEGSEDQLLRYAALAPDEAPQNTPAEFLAVCGVVGLGYLAARGEGSHFTILRAKASDPRWRIREAVALGLQKYGATSIEPLLEVMAHWSKGGLLERRAVVATLCEPGLLTERENALRIMDLLDEITASIPVEEDKRTQEFKTLRKGLGYGWSVAVASHPDIGKARMEKWIQSKEPDVRWIMRQNLKKKRLSSMDAAWVRTQMERLDG